MAKEKIKIEITLKDGIPKPPLFTRKLKIKREIKMPDDGDYGFLRVFDVGGAKEMFFIKVGLIDEVDIK